MKGTSQDKGKKNRLQKKFQKVGSGIKKKCIFAALFQTTQMAIVAQLVRVPDCGSVGRRFESDLSPEKQWQEIVAAFLVANFPEI